MSLLTLLAILSLASQDPATNMNVSASPFAGFETRELANGLKVWFKRLPDDPVVTISVALPFGSDRDPPGKEQLAHFTEHMLFSDQPGRSEEEIRREIEELGGVYNASVTPDRTFYYVHIGAEHVDFALEWLGRIISPHAMDAGVVEQQREPVALEVGARPRQFIDWLWAYYIYPPALRTPGFWQREFGIEAAASRDYYPYASLHRITSEDLRRFYDEYYVPSLMTLTVIGDVDRREVMQRIDETFGSLPQRPSPEVSVTLNDPGRYRQTIFWPYRPNVYYNLRFKFYDPSAEDEVMLIFISELLGKRLNDQLRFGERKATYGIGVGIIKRGPAAYLTIRGGIKEEEFEFARSVIEAEVEALRVGSMDIEEYEADRDAVTRQLIVTNSTSEDLERWVRTYFYDRRVHGDFPDLVAAFETVTLDDVQRFVSERFVAERQVLTVWYPNPISQGILLVLIAFLARFSVIGMRRRLIRPIDMTRIRYVARFRIPPLYLLAAALIILLLLAVLLRGLAYGIQVMVEGFLVTVDSFIVQWSVYGALLAAGVALVLVAMSRVPRKLLLFDDRVLIKYQSYRSVEVPRDEIEELSLCGFRAVWLTSRIRKCVPLALGATAPAIYLRHRDGWSYYFRVRDMKELLGLLGVKDSEAADPEDVQGPT